MCIECDKNFDIRITGSSRTSIGSPRHILVSLRDTHQFKRISSSIRICDDLHIRSTSSCVVASRNQLEVSVHVSLHIGSNLCFHNQIGRISNHHKRTSRSRLGRIQRDRTSSHCTRNRITFSIDDTNNNTTRNCSSSTNSTSRNARGSTCTIKSNDITRNQRSGTDDNVHIGLAIVRSTSQVLYRLKAGFRHKSSHLRPPFKKLNFIPTWRSLCLFSTNFETSIEFCIDSILFHLGLKLIITSVFNLLVFIKPFLFLTHNICLNTLTNRHFNGAALLRRICNTLVTNSNTFVSNNFIAHLLERLDTIFDIVNNTIYTTGFLSPHVQSITNPIDGGTPRSSSFCLSHVYAPLMRLTSLIYSSLVMMPLRTKVFITLASSSVRENESLDPPCLVPPTSTPFGLDRLGFWNLSEYVFLILLVTYSRTSSGVLLGLLRAYASPKASASARISESRSYHLFSDTQDAKSGCNSSPVLTASCAACAF